MEIFMEYPLVFGNELHDGSWHNIEAERLYCIGRSPLYLMEYLDKKFDRKSFTILVCSEDKFSKATLIKADDVANMVNGSLEHVDLDVLPSEINASTSIAFDLTDLTLRALEKYAVISPYPPPTPVSGVVWNYGSGCPAYRVKADGQMPSFEGQALRVRKGCRIATLFIREKAIYLGSLDGDSLIMKWPSQAELIHILASYYIVWRNTDFSLITNVGMIGEALMAFGGECRKNGTNVLIKEIDTRSIESRMAGVLPVWLRSVSHRYEVGQGARVN